MLFNSFAFVLGFLPVVFAGYFLVSRYSPSLGVAFLALASLAFYGWWDYRLLPLLLVSILANYFIGCAIADARARDQARARSWLVLGLVLNLGCLIFFKYLNWLNDTLQVVAGVALPIGKVILPLGISFYTFTQIAFLVDSYKGKVRERNLRNYGLFVTYFPHLIAGPVLHHAEMMPQFADASKKRIAFENIVFGLALFLIGVVKKVVLADSVSPLADQVFNATGPLNASEAWLGALAYTAQIYFDFSGYSDMALGISRLFNINLPLNFNSPYKARSIVDFWRRWHMSLSRFLRDYLYIALGGNRRGMARRYANLFATMVLGGLWHGAGWTFLIWGALHGAYLIVDHAVCAAAKALGIVWRNWMAPFTQGLTLLAVIIGWVFFRATSLDGALRVLAGMTHFGAHGTFPPMNETTEGLMGYLSVTNWGWIVALMALALFAPNSQEIIARAEAFTPRFAAPKIFAPMTVASFAFTLLMFVVSLSSMRDGVSPFIYFNF